MTKRHLFWIIIAAFVGISAAYSVNEGGRAAYYYLFNEHKPFVYLSSMLFSNAQSEVSPEKRPKPPAQGKSILADLTEMQLELYENGELVETYPIITKGKKGTPWEILAGNHSVSSKNDKLFSPIGKVWLPYSIQFSRNSFIHGETSSGGGISLKTRDAKKVYDFSELGTPVLVFKMTSGDEQAIKHYQQKSKEKPPVVTGKAYLVADLDSGEVLEEKSSNLVLPIASVTKLMTALVSLDVINQSQVVTVSKRAATIGGTSGGLKKGEKIEAGNLIYPLLLASANDAAEALAEHYGRDEFIKLMNEKAKDIGLEQTSFEDPTGLSPHNVSSAKDLYKLANYILSSKPYIFDVSSKLGHTAVNHSWFNTNNMAAVAYFLGGKNGFTDEAKQTMLSLWSIPFSTQENRRLVLINLGSVNRKADAEELLRHVKKTVTYLPQILPQPALLASGMVLGTSTNVVSVAGPRIQTPLTLAFVGDMMLDRGVEKSVMEKGGGDFSWLFQNVSDLKSADILFGNLEGPLSNQSKDLGNKYSFRMAPAALDALVAAGFDAVTVANNHAGDWGLAAFADTLDRLSKANIIAAGGGANFSEASRVKIIGKNGYRIGFLGATDVGPNWLAAGDSKAGLLLASDPRWPEIIKNAANQVNILIVSYHFGEEYQKEPTARQRELAKMAIDNGARLVIGHHPHVTQTVEKYKNGIIAFSLGNFIFDQYFSEDTMTGLVLKVKFNGSDIVEAGGVQVKLSPEYRPSLQTTNEE